MMIYSFIFGPIILCLLYAFCFFLVVGVKVVIYFFKVPKNNVEKPKPTSVSPRKIPERPRKSVKSIEIDPDFIDRIYVKKSS